MLGSRSLEASSSTSSRASSGASSALAICSASLHFRSCPIRSIHLAKAPAVDGCLDASARSRRVLGECPSMLCRPSLSCCRSGQWMMIYSGVSGPVPQGQRGVTIPGTRRSARKAIRPILPVRICVKVALSCLGRPSRRLRACGLKSAVVSAGSGRDRGCLALAAATFRPCLVFQSRMTASSAEPGLSVGVPPTHWQAYRAVVSHCRGLSVVRRPLGSLCRSRRLTYVQACWIAWLIPDLLSQASNAASLWLRYRSIGGTKASASRACVGVALYAPVTRRRYSDCLGHLCCDAPGWAVGLGRGVVYCCSVGNRPSYYLRVYLPGSYKGVAPG
jgi:hypothetical protein